MDELISRASLVAHKLKAPLSTIYTSSQVLLDGLVGELSGEQRDIIKRIFDNASRGIGYIEEYLENGIKED
ncbi:MAG: hypothetical protein JXA66_00875 [Oligoflexia bacterium]|nr:hypothetical protein [Oligoflexia bacterium]